MAGLSTSECVLALDFDGVIWDSVGECYQIARRTWQKLYGPVPDDRWAPFRSGRWLVRTGEDFYVLLRLILEGGEQNFNAFSQERFNSLREQWHEEVHRFDQTFYAQREQTREEDPALWLSWQAPFPQVVQALPQIRAEFRSVGIATTKDEASVRLLLSTVGIELPVVGKGTTRNKSEQMQRLADAAGVPTQQVVFVDDLLENLEQARRAGAQAALAGWGYNTPAQQAQAREQGFGVLLADPLLVELRRVFDLT